MEDLLLDLGGSSGGAVLMAEASGSFGWTNTVVL